MDQSWISSSQRNNYLWSCSFTNVFRSTACESVSHTQVVVEEVEEHQHAAAHDYKNTDHDGGDVNRLFVLLLCGLVPLQLKVASGGTTNGVNQGSLLGGVHHPGAVSKPRRFSPFHWTAFGVSWRVARAVMMITSSIYRQLPSWLATTRFSLHFKTHNPCSKLFSACGPVRHRRRLTVPLLWHSIGEDGLG